MPSLRFWLAVLIAGLAWTVTTAAASSCPFCEGNAGPTLVGEFAKAELVLYGHIGGSKVSSGNDLVSEFIIERIIKPHESVKDKKTITLSRNIAAGKSKFLLFGDVFKGSVDAYRGVEVQPDSDMVKYLDGALQLQKKTQPERLRYCFEYLNNPEYEIAMDAYREYAKADYKDYMDMAKKLPPDVIAGWLRDPKTPPFRYGLYASLLGHCGRPEHAKLLRSMVDDPEKRKGSGIDGLLAAYVMLEPKTGWQYVQEIIKDKQQEFLTRYAGLRTVRFLWEQRPDLVPQKELAGGLALVLDQADMADFGIEDLRKYKCWDATDRVLDLFGKKTHDIPVVKRSILRFALQSPSPRAAMFVLEQSKRDSEWVKDVQELLKLESQ